MSDPNSNILLEYIKNSKNFIIFTGAGISTEYPSSIPDFRSSSGLYSTGKFKEWKPEQILSRRFFLMKPEVFYEFYKERLLSMADKKPNRSHYALAKLEEMGLLKCVITQNIDNLHQTAGNKMVLDLHGNGSICRCISCSNKYPIDYMHKLLETSNIPRCECGGKVRPDTVLFDEWLNDDVYDGAMKVIKMADLIVSIGTSLVVQPAAGLLSEKSQECKLVIINNTETPYDRKAELIIRENCGLVLEEVVKSYKNTQLNKN